MVSYLSTSMSLDKVLCINTEEKGKAESPSQSLFIVNNRGAEICFFFFTQFFFSVPLLLCMNALDIS